MSDSEEFGGSGVSNEELVAAATAAMNGSEQPEQPEEAGDEVLETAEVPVKVSRDMDGDVDPRAILRARMEKARAAKAAKAESRRQAEMAEKLRAYEAQMSHRQPEAPQFDLDGFKSKFHQSPLAALQDLGVDLDTFTQRVIEENTPQSKMLAQMKALQDKIEAFERQKQEVEKREQAQTRERERFEQDQAFCAIITPDDYPSLHEFFKDDPYALIREADALATQLVKAGNDPDLIEDSDIADYLETKYEKIMSRVRGKAEAQRTAQPLPGKTRPRAPSRAETSDNNIGKTKDFWEMSASEQDALLKEVARNAMSNAN